MGFLTDLMGGGEGNSSETVSNLDDQRSAVGERGMLVRDNARLTITDGGAVRRALDFSTRSQDRAFSFGDKAMSLLAGAYANDNDDKDDTQQLMIVALIVVGAVAVMAVRK